MLKHKTGQDASEVEEAASHDLGSNGKRAASTQLQMKISLYHVILGVAWLPSAECILLTTRGVFPSRRRNAKNGCDQHYAEGSML
jgi:hypothetical protein